MRILLIACCLSLLALGTRAQQGGAVPNVVVYNVSDVMPSVSMLAFKDRHMYNRHFKLS